MSDLPPVTEVVPGEYDVEVVGTVHRVLIPVGVGVPGVAEDDLAGALLLELMARGYDLPATIDVSGLLRADPSLLEAVADSLAEEDDGEV